MSDSLTPMMRQYLDIKKECPDAILFFRLGDFYEMFFEDAVEASKILHITLTSRGSHKGAKVPMCGIPHHASENYIARLVKSGKKVAVCDQVEGALSDRKIFHRKITRIITPGTLVAEGMCFEPENSYILSVDVKNGVYGLAYADVSTGEFNITEIEGTDRLFPEIYKIDPAETILPRGSSGVFEFEQIKEAGLGAVTLKDDWFFDPEKAKQELKGLLRVKTLEAFGCQDMETGLGAAGALIEYLKDTQKCRLDNIRSVKTYNASEYMVLDRVSHRHLELTENQEDLSSTGTLFEVLDRTMTPMGKRKLKKWLLNPLLDRAQICRRLDAVEYFCRESSLRMRMRDVLSRMYDMERLANKVSLGSANARDMTALADSLDNVKILGELAGDTLPEAVSDLVSALEDLSGIIIDIRSCIADDPPAGIKDGAIIRKGYDSSVDELRELADSGRSWLVNFQAREIERTGISSLKVGYNRVFGYYVEVTNTNLGSVPADYTRKQTLTNAERFVTPALKEQEDRILGAEEKVKVLEYEIFCALREKVAGAIDAIKHASETAALVDVISALSETSSANRYVRPNISSSDTLTIKDGRHPVLEKILKDKEFVSNDCLMDGDEKRIFIITGSNMAGKSTFIRQVALITIMAQMGSFVPASEAEIGIVDRIFTRVGASDRLYQGMSTFMVEMIETANILNNATERSLIVLDEVGRGTSTFDGVSIAWAVVEYIHRNLKGAKTMFATHYHELTELAGVMKGVENYHLAVQEWGEEIIFLYKAESGSCDESFGIHVAKLAGMPESVVKRAREILANLHRDSFTGNVRSRFTRTLEEDSGKCLEESLSAASPGKKDPEKQLDFFKERKLPSLVAEKIIGLNIDNITPMEALRTISEIKDELLAEELSGKNVLEGKTKCGGTK
ncbi:MAG: DNA mismatch repair protein MutS [Candidatus Omnitrophota bacterium]